MKKTYINPQITVVAIGAQAHLMAGSTKIVTLKTEDVSDGDGFVQATRKSLWDEEDDI